ncbi:MAG: hypothetical protein ACHQD7_03285 [Chitinophagales bacterium]
MGIPDEQSACLSLQTLFFLIQTSIIRRFSAAFFLLLFSFCVTPKRFLHDLLANHRDTERTANQPAQQVFAAGFHCHCDDLVVVAPFLADIHPIEAPVIVSARFTYAEQLNDFVFRYLPHTGVRGPPQGFCS